MFSLHRYLEKNLEYLCAWVDDLANEQYKFQQELKREKWRKKQLAAGAADDNDEGKVRAVGMVASEGGGVRKKHLMCYHMNQPICVSCLCYTSFRALLVSIPDFYTRLPFFFFSCHARCLTGWLLSWWRTKSTSTALRLTPSRAPPLPSCSLPTAFKMRKKIGGVPEGRERDREGDRESALNERNI